jgi:DNA (cytosine-5)-methyltransferase 1
MNDFFITRIDGTMNDRLQINRFSTDFNQDKDMNMDSIPVIDLFAGPGGLGEGFSSLTYRKNSAFNVCLSIEKDASAYRTLHLRSFFRKVPFSLLKEPFIDFAKSQRTQEDEQALYSSFREAKRESEWEVMCKELGSPAFPPKEIDSIIHDHLAGASKWVLIGGPPCQAYSLPGRSRMSHMRRNNLEEFEKDERHRLYQHYLRIIAKHEPPVFVMENVKGMLSSTLKGKLIIEKILQDLRHPAGNRDLSYKLYPFVNKNQSRLPLFNDEEFEAPDFVIKAEEYGIPQARHRVIILGIRSDIKLVPKTLEKSHLNLTDVISDLPDIRSELSARWGKDLKWDEQIRDITIALQNGYKNTEVRKQILRNLKRLRDDLGTGGPWMPYASRRPKKIVKDLYRNPDFGGVCNHEARSHMPSDLQRYFFAASFAQVTASNSQPKSPRLVDFPKALLPAHNNIDLHRIEKTIFEDRFRVQLSDRPATTITSHISQDGHYYIHPDPLQCRSLTVREAARIQTFPDSYIFLGSRTSQYQQVGNAVPPLLARQLAKVVFDLLKRWSRSE